MDLHRPEQFNELFGNKKKIQMIQGRLRERSFPKFVFFVADEGLGKTSLAYLCAMALNCDDTLTPCYTCPSCLKIRDEVIRGNRDTLQIKRFTMSVDGGIEKAKEIVNLLNTNFIDNGHRVVIMDECHRMDPKAQDLVLTAFENIPDGVTVIACTTDIDSIQPALQSRAVIFNLNTLTAKEITQLLENDARRRGLEIEGGGAILELIGQWAEYKPRKALKALEAMGESKVVSMSDIKDFTNFLEVKEVIPIISSFAGAISIGMNAIFELSTDQETYKSLIALISEAYRLKIGQRTTKLSSEDKIFMRAAIKDIPEELLTEFLYEVTRMHQFTREGLLGCYLKCHPARRKVFEHGEENLTDEMNAKYSREDNKISLEDDTTKEKLDKIPSFEEMMRNGSIIEK